MKSNNQTYQSLSCNHDMGALFKSLKAKRVLKYMLPIIGLKYCSIASSTDVTSLLGLFKSK